jgi:hypothetical protein
VGEARAELLELTVGRIAHELSALAQETAGDVYAIGLLTDVDDELARPPLLELAWNTQAKFVEVERAAGGRLRLNSRWNTGTWLNQGGRIDNDLGAPIERALTECGLGAPQPDPFSDEGGERRVAQREAAGRFIADVSRALHDRGVIERAIGHDVIVLCQTGSDSDPWTRLTLDANPPELHGDFREFHEQEGTQDETF